MRQWNGPILAVDLDSRASDNKPDCEPGWSPPLGYNNSCPWGTTARQVEEILTHSRPYGVAEAMEHVITRARERRAAEEREVVATEVQRAIARSGMNRAQLASCLGTSTSRLSTYATGKVTPSATFMVRLRRALGQTGNPTD